MFLHQPKHKPWGEMNTFDYHRFTAISVLRNNLKKTSKIDYFQIKKIIVKINISDFFKTLLNEFALCFVTLNGPLGFFS